MKIFNIINDLLGKNTQFISYAIFVFFTCLYFSSTVGGMNSGDSSQFALTKSIVDHQTFQIDKNINWTYWTDYVTINNHYYLDREPGLSILAIPFYLTSKITSAFAVPLYGGFNRNINSDSIIQAFTYLTTAVFGALGIVILYKICLTFQISQLSAFFTAIIMGTGTLFWKYSSSFFREPVFTTFFLLTIYLFLIIQKSKKNQAKYLFFAGLSLGISILVDYSKFYLIPFFIIYHSLLKKPNLSNKKRSLLFFLGLSIPLIFIFYYNFQVFQNPFTNPHLHKNYFKWMQNPDNLFKTPLIPGIITNLFNNGPINRGLLEFFWQNPYISFQMGAYWATVWTYKGIFIQTPVLFLAIFGWFIFLKKFRKEALLLLISSICILIINSKMTVFWAGPSYDTRYFLPVPIILLIGLPFHLDYIFKLKNRFKKLFLFGLFLYLSLISIYNGWYSNLTNFAPHLSGEHRFYWESLLHPFWNWNNLFVNFRILIFNSFPNVYNLDVFLTFYLFPFSILYMIYLYFKYPKKENE